MTASTLGEAAPRVRKYHPGDRAGVLRVMADTAYFGEPVEAFLEDRDLFCEAFCACYTDLEPERVWVAASGGQVVGTLLGCSDTTRQQRLWRREILPAVLKRWLTGRYRAGPLTWRYACNHAVSFLKGEHARAMLEPYPAHLHINVDARWRGRGLGKRLVEAYLEQLREMGVPGVHLSTTSLNRAAVALYTKMGFQLLDARTTHAWRNWVATPVENRLYGLRL